MNRRKFLSAAATTLGALGFDADILPCADAATPASASRPNVLILMSGQHKRACMGVAADSVARTRNLDALARESLRFSTIRFLEEYARGNEPFLLDELYDLRIDPDDTDNFAAGPQHRATADRLKQQLFQWHRPAEI